MKASKMPIVREIENTILNISVYCTKVLTEINFSSSAFCSSKSDISSSQLECL